MLASAAVLGCWPIAQIYGQSHWLRSEDALGGAWQQHHCRENRALLLSVHAYAGARRVQILWPGQPCSEEQHRDLEPSLTGITWQMQALSALSSVGLLFPGAVWVVIFFFLCFSFCQFPQEREQAAQMMSGGMNQLAAALAKRHLLCCCEFLLSLLSSSSAALLSRLLVL